MHGGGVLWGGPGGGMPGEREVGTGAKTRSLIVGLLHLNMERGWMPKDLRISLPVNVIPLSRWLKFIYFIDFSTFFFSHHPDLYGLHPSRWHFQLLRDSLGSVALFLGQMPEVTNCPFSSNRAAEPRSTLSVFFSVMCFNLPWQTCRSLTAHGTHWKLLFSGCLVDIWESFSL